MERLVFYGKGGIGKSTISANLAANLAGRGYRVLHVGCDPKHDSTVALMGGEMIPTVVDRRYRDVVAPEDIISVSATGVHCVEAGGPDAGVGCAGRGISRALEVFNQADLLSPERYDVVTFDLLGDVVCGGFAAPLSQGMGEKVVIVSSEEMMSLYAANNIAKAIVTYASAGIVCAGMVLNLRDADEDLAPVHRFAQLLNTRVIGVLRRDPQVREAELRRISVVEHAPDGPFVAELGALGDTILAIEPGQCPVPSPLSDRDFHAFSRHGFVPPPGEHERTEWMGRAAGKAGACGPPVEPPHPRHVPPAGDVLRQSYQRDLKAGIAAVRRGLVSPAEAVKRLQATYPDFTHHLQSQDLET